MGIYHTNPNLERSLSKPIEEAYGKSSNQTSSDKIVNPEYSSIEELSKMKKDILGLLYFE